MSGERVQRYAEAINRHQEWLAGESVPMDPTLARAVMAVADAELADLRTEVERLSRPHRVRPEVRNAWKDRAEAAEAQVARLSRECLDRESTEMDKASRLAAAEAQVAAIEALVVKGEEAQARNRDALMRDGFAGIWQNEVPSIKDFRAVLSSDES